MMSVLVVLFGCSPATSERAANTTVYVPKIANDALSWRAPAYVPALAGLDVLRDGPGTASVTLAVTRVVLRTNARLAPLDALRLSAAAVRAARANALVPEFFCATLLQESAFDPAALSVAGAVGIAQFMPATAQAYGVDPYAPADAIRGAAALLGAYVRAYRSVYADPYAAALAAYNAGPGAVAYYRGIPPYPQTRAYVGYVYARWARIVAAERQRPAMRRRV